MLLKLGTKKATLFSASRPFPRHLRLPPLFPGPVVRRRSSGSCRRRVRSPFVAGPLRSRRAACHCRSNPCPNPSSDAGAGAVALCSGATFRASQTLLVWGVRGRSPQCCRPPPPACCQRRQLDGSARRCLSPDSGSISFQYCLSGLGSRRSLPCSTFVSFQVCVHIRPAASCAVLLGWIRLTSFLALFHLRQFSAGSAVCAAVASPLLKK